MTPIPNRYAASSASRRVSFLLALGITLLMFATLVAMGSFNAPMGGKGSRLVAVSLAGEREKAAASPAKKRETAEQASTTQALVPPVKPAVTLPTPNTYRLPDGFIQMSKAEMASADIGRAPRVDGRAGGGSEGGSGGGGSGAGQGPGGAMLYNAEWVREPTNAELATYLPAKRDPGAWGLIACRTIDRFRVEDCRELDESPRGSGMARAMRQASWQFLVRPPRENGKPLLGVWVRIRFDITPGRSSPAAGEGQGPAVAAGGTEGPVGRSAG